jgi:hypothetical protein
MGIKSPAIAILKNGWVGQGPMCLINNSLRLKSGDGTSINAGY